MRQLALLSALLSTVALAADPLPEKGTLCFQEKNEQKCRATEGTTLAVAAAETPRLFVWSSTDGTRIVLGGVAPKATSIAFDDKALSEVTLGIRGDRRRGWPANVRVAITSKEREWAFPVSAKVVEKLTVIRMPAGTYRMSIAAEHHVTEKRALNAPKSIALREINLKPLPVISGRVVSLKDEPIAGAQLMRPDGKVQATADEQGQFRAELSEPLPDAIILMQSHFASTLVPLGDLNGDIDLGTVHLGAGMKLALHLVRPDVEDIPLHVRLLEKSPRKYEHTPIATRELKAKEKEISFSDLGAGTYFVVIEGKDPLQRFSKDFEIKDADVEKEVRIAPFRLDGSVRVGDEPLRDGTIEVQDSTHSWRARVMIDDTGHFGGSMWQTGKVSGFVNTPAIAELVESPELGTDPSAWDVVFKRRYIRGRIFDEETNQPVERPSLRLQITSGERRSYTSGTVQPDGNYSVLAARTGTYELRVEAPDHTPAKATVAVAEADAERKIDFPLARGAQQVIEFTWPSGEVVANAMVLEGVSSDGHNPERLYSTDGAGRLTVTMRRGEAKTVYILPREGSFAIVHIVAPRESADTKPMQVVIAPPTASLIVNARDREGKPASALTVIRYNGELLPQPVIARLSEDGEHVFPRLPAGAYEVWAVGARFEQLIGVVPVRPAEHVSLTTGEAAITVTVEPGS